MSQYGIRIYSEDFKKMKWDEFKAMIAGLGPETILGRIVSIRSETDKEIIKNFGKEENRIRSEWFRRRAQMASPEQIDGAMEQIKQALIAMAK